VRKDFVAKTLLTVDNVKMITFDDFKKLDIRVGKILSAEKVSG